MPRAPRATGAEDAQDDGTNGPQASEAEDANIRPVPGTGALGSDVERSSISENSPPSSTEKSSLTTDVSFSGSAATPASAFTCANTDSNITSPDGLDGAIHLNDDDSDVSVSEASNGLKNKEISSLRSQLAQSIEI